MEAKTKVIQGYFGPKQVNKEQFIAEWKMHFSACFNLADTREEFLKLKDMQVTIMALAGKAWERIPEKG